jgi:hypothetical protein
MRPEPLVVAVLVVLVVGSSVIPPVSGTASGRPLPTPNATQNGTTTATTTGSSSATATPAPSDGTDTNGTTSAPITAGDNGTGNASGACAGLGTVERAVCLGIQEGASVLVEGVLDWLATELMTGLRNGAETVVEVLVSRPVPLRNGEVAIAERPTNPPMDTVYDLWLGVGLPGGLAIWALMMLLTRLSLLLPSRLVPGAQSRAKLLAGWFGLFRILFSWIWCAIVLHLTLGIAVWFAPSGDQILAGFDALGETAVGAGIAGLVLYLSSGVLFILVVLVFGLSFLAPFVLMPAYPLFIALSLPDFWIFEWVAQKGEFLRSLFAPAALLPVPTAIILGTGYPIINAIQGELTGPVGSIIGIPTYVLLLLVMWGTALIAPVFLFFGTRNLRPLSMFAAGALGAATAVNTARGARGLRDRLQRPNVGWPSSSDSTGTTTDAADGSVDPVDGSPFSRDDASRGERPLGAGGGRSDPQPLEAGPSSAPAPITDTEAGFITNSGTSSTGSDTATTTGGRTSATGWDRVTDRSADAYAESVPDDVAFTQATARPDLDRDRYDAGYFDSRGEFKSLTQGPSDTGWLLDEGGFNRISSKKPEEPILLYDEENSAAYDVREVVQEGQYRKARYSRQHQESINIIEGTRDR